MQALSCIISTTRELGTTVGKGLMCLCQICAELLLIFYFFTNYWQIVPPASLFHRIFPVGVECHLFTLYSGNFALTL